jgi:hypothetical protein
VLRIILESGTRIFIPVEEAMSFVSYTRGSPKPALIGCVCVELKEPKTGVKGVGGFGGSGKGVQTALGCTDGSEPPKTVSTTQQKYSVVRGLVVQSNS